MSNNSTVEQSTERLRELCARVESREHTREEIMGLLTEIRLELAVARSLQADKLIEAWATLLGSIEDQFTRTAGPLS